MNQKTYCPELWRSISIDNKGNVFSCCLNKPLKFGNINDTTLVNIINDDSIVACREQSLKGLLSCHDGCTWVRAEETNGEKDSVRIGYDELEIITIAFGEACNISCIMCKQRKRIIPNDVILKSNTLIENLDISPFKKIFLTGGEPLLMNECVEYMEHLASIGKKFGFSTNGMLLTDGLIEFLAPNLDFITFSLNAATEETHEMVNVGSTYAKVLGNIKKLRDVREAKGYDFTIIGRMTLTVPALHEIPAFIVDHKNLGFDRINFSFDKATVLPYLVDNPDFADELKNRISCALREVKCRQDIDIHRLRLLNLVNEDVPFDGWWEL